MVQAVAVYKMLANKPFQPVRVVLKDGRSYDITSRRMIIVGVDFLVIGFQAEGRSEGIWGSELRVPLEDVLRVEPSAAATIA